MGIAERKQREKEYREASILEAAKNAFLAKGLIATTMDDIAAAAELGKGTLYRHYRSKEDIMLAIRELALRQLRALYVQEAAGPGDGLARVLRMIRRYRAFMLDHPAYFGFIAFFESPLAAAANPEAGYGPTTAIDEVYRDVLRQGMQDGSVRTDLKAEQLVSMLCAVCSGMMQYLVSQAARPAAPPADLGELFETFLASVRDGLRHPGGPG